jgi:beta-glucosidase
MKGRTYRFFKGEPLFPFGYGLSYSTFAYRDLRVQGANVSVEVENTSAIAGEEVVQLYVKRSAAGPDDPIRSLAGFQRVALKPRERKIMRFTLKTRSPGTFDISVGALRRSSVQLP